MFFQFINLQGLDHTNKQKFTSRNVLPNLTWWHFERNCRKYLQSQNQQVKKKTYLSTINMKNISCVLLMSMYLFKSNKVGWIALSVIENDKHNKVIGVVNHRIIQNVGLLSWFLRWYPHSTLSHRVFPGEDFTQVHSPVPLAIWSRVCCLSWVASIYSKIYSFSKCCGCKFKEKLAPKTQVYEYTRYFKKYSSFNISSEQLKNLAN